MDLSLEFGLVWSAVLSFVLAQDGYESVLSNSILRTAIASVARLSVVADMVRCRLFADAEFRGKYMKYMIAGMYMTASLVAAG